MNRIEEMALEMQMLREENIALKTRITGMDFEMGILYHYLHLFQEHKPPKVKRVIYSDKATILFDKKGRKTLVKCAKGDDYDLRLGFCLALLKSIYGKKELDRLMDEFVYNTDEYKALKKEKKDNGKRKKKN